MVTLTTLPSSLYAPLTPLAAKLPDVSFPLKSAPCSIAALLALATNVPGIVGDRGGPLAWLLTDYQPGKT